LLIVLAGMIRYFQSQNSEEAIKAFLVTFSQVAVIWVLGVFTLIGIAVIYKRRRTLVKKAVTDA